MHLAASDPANPYGSLLPWIVNNTEHNMSRASGASVVLVNGQLAAFLRRGNPAVRVMLPEDEPDRTQFARDIAQKLAEVAIQRQSKRSGLLIGTINDINAAEHFLAGFLEESGFIYTPGGFHMRRLAPHVTEEPEEDEVSGDA